MVPTWDRRRRDGLGRCLEAILSQARPPDQVIAVVDHDPELLAWVGEAFPAVESIANRGARGVVGARNRGSRPPAASS